MILHKSHINCSMGPVCHYHYLPCPLPHSYTAHQLLFLHGCSPPESLPWRTLLILYTFFHVPLFFHRLCILMFYFVDDVPINLAYFIWTSLWRKHWIAPFYFFFFLFWLPWGIWSLGDQGSDLSHSWDRCCSCGNTGSLIHCAKLGTEPAFQRSRDAANPICTTAGTPKLHGSEFNSCSELRQTVKLQ